MLNNFFAGLAFNTKGFAFVSQHKGLWRYIWIPVILNFFVFFTLVFFYVKNFEQIFGLFSDVFGFLHLSNPEHFWQYLLLPFVWLLQLVLKLFVFLISVFLLLFFVFIMAGFVNAPFYEMLSEATLIQLGVLAKQRFSLRHFAQSFLHSFRIEIRKFVFLSLPSLVFLLLGWVPIIGVVFSLVSIFFLAWYFGFSVLIYPMVLLKLDFKQIFSFGVRHKALLLGLGFPCLIPLVGFFFTSFQIVGGTILYVEKRFS